MKKKKKPPTISDACREARLASGDTQQFFCARMGIAISTLQNYEGRGRVPEPKQLVAYTAIAYTIGRDDLAQVFVAELERQLEPPRGYPSPIMFPLPVRK